MSCHTGWRGLLHWSFMSIRVPKQFPFPSLAEVVASCLSRHRTVVGMQWEERMSVSSVCFFKIKERTANSFVIIVGSQQIQDFVLESSLSSLSLTKIVASLLDNIRQGNVQVLTTRECFLSLQTSYTDEPINIHGSFLKCIDFSQPLMLLILLFCVQCHPTNNIVVFSALCYWFTNLKELPETENEGRCVGSEWGWGNKNTIILG